MVLNGCAVKNPTVCLAAAACLLLGLCVTARAGDYKDKDFSLRFPAALNRFSPYADAAAVGGASAGSKWSSSINPASTGWLALPGRYGVSLSPQYSALCFDQGTKMHVTSQAGVVDLKKWGVLQPAIAQVHSNTRTTSEGLDFNYEMEFYQLQWGKRLGKWAAGANFSYALSETEHQLSGLRVVRTRSDTYALRVGGLCEVVDKLLAGLVLDYGESKGRTVFYDFLGFGIGEIKVHDTTRQYGVRPGVSYEYMEDSAVFFDYQYLRLTNDTGRLRIHRFHAGVDHRLIEGLFVRAGTAFDIRGNAAVTCGVGIYPTDWFTIDVAYQCDMYPEVDLEFGPSHAVTLSLGFTF